MNRSAWAGIGAVLLTGCVSRGELAAALAEDVRYTSRVVGFALEAQEEALRTRRLLLQVLADHPRREELLRQVEPPEALEAKDERLARARRELLEEGQRLLRRFGADGADASAE